MYRTTTVVIVFCCLLSLTVAAKKEGGEGIEFEEAVNSGFTCGPNLVGNSGPITVDGDASDWNPVIPGHTSDDFFADMHRAGKIDKIIESHLYLRFDCATRILYMLVHTVAGVTFDGVLDNTQFFIKFDSNNPFEGSSGKPDAASGWTMVFNSADPRTATLFEASFRVPETYTGGDINVHAQVFDQGSQTSATSSGIDTTRLIPLYLPVQCADCTHEMVTKRVGPAGESPLAEIADVTCASDCRDACFVEPSCHDYLYDFTTDLCQLFSSAVDPANWVDSDIHLSGNCPRDSASPSSPPPPQSASPSSPPALPSLPVLPSQSPVLEPSTEPFIESESPSTPPANPSAGSFDDPLIRGFNGQSFYFSGSLDDVYNLVTSKHLQINMRIISHEGMWKLNSWMGEIGIASYGHTVSFNNNSEAFLDGEPCPEDRYINVNDNFEVKYSSKNGSLDVTIDKTIKMALRVHSNDWTKFKTHLDLSFKGDITSLGMIHGVLGQTVYKKPLEDRNQHEENVQGEGIIDGDYLDYKVGRNDIFGTNFTYNLYSPEELEIGGAQRRLMSIPHLVEAHIG